MKIVEINSVLYGSTGKIMLQIAETARAKGHKVWVCVPFGRHNKTGDENTIFIGNSLSEDTHLVMSRLTGLNGSFSIIATKIFIHKIKKLRPDVIHLHNLHNSYINLPILFNYIKNNNIKVVWTLHDCWSFTGHCPYFTLKKCEKWKTGCYSCSSYKEYPEAFIDTTKITYQLKKKWFTGIKNLTIVTPSQWLADLISESFLNEYDVKVINNGIDINIFKPVISNFRNKLNINEKQIILLGVAFDWGIRKGLDVFINLYERLDKKKFKIVLVGLDENQGKSIPRGIIKISKTRNQYELAEIYSAADIFINPTREDNFPTVNMEAIACGTPVITFNTGGSVEVITNKTGVVVPCDDLNALENKINQIAENKLFSVEELLDFAKNFNCKNRFEEYIELYENITHYA